MSPTELAQIVAPYVHRELATEDLEELRLKLTRAYIDRGYINSGAIISDQAVHEGVMTLRIIEGELSHIEMQGNRWFRSGYLRRRLRNPRADEDHQKTGACHQPEQHGDAH